MRIEPTVDFYERTREKGTRVGSIRYSLASRPPQSGCSVSPAVFVGLVLSWDLLLAFDADIWGWWTQNAIFLCSLNSSLLTQPLPSCRLLATSSSRFLVLSLCSTKAGSYHMGTKSSLGDHFYYLWPSSLSCALTVHLMETQGLLKSSFSPSVPNGELDKSSLSLIKLTHALSKAKPRGERLGYISDHFLAWYFPCNVPDSECLLISPRQPRTSLYCPVHRA